MTKSKNLKYEILNQVQDDVILKRNGVDSRLRHSGISSFYSLILSPLKGEGTNRKVERVT